MADEAKQSGQVDEILNDFNKKNSTMTILIIVFALITVIGGAGAGYFFLFRGKETAAEPAKAEAPAAAAPASGEHGKMIGTVVRLDPFIVNLNEVDASRYLKVAIEVEVTGEETVKELEKRNPQIRDLTVGVLSSKSFADIQGADGKFRLKEELMFSLNKVLVSGQITQIFFTQFVVQ